MVQYPVRSRIVFSGGAAILNIDMGRKLEVIEKEVKRFQRLLEDQVTGL